MTFLAHCQSPPHAKSITGCSQVSPRIKGKFAIADYSGDRAFPLWCLQVMKNERTYLQMWLELKGMEGQNVVSLLNPIIC